jgi:hypothetical protein
MEESVTLHLRRLKAEGDFCTRQRIENVLSKFGECKISAGV